MNNLLSDELREIIPKDVSFIIEETSEELSDLFNNLASAQYLNSVLVKNEKENIIRNVWQRIHDGLGRPKHKLSEAMHIYRNILPYFDNIFVDESNSPLNSITRSQNTSTKTYGYRQDNHVTLTGENSSEQWNLNRDPQSHARIGQNCDLVITSNKLCWSPELLIVEVSGGILPQCSAHKAWKDKIKFGIGLRDALVQLENELPGINQAVYGVQVVEHLESFRSFAQQSQIVGNEHIEFKRKKYNDRKRRLENQPTTTVQPVVIGTPITKKGRLN
ncbi:hypothetical protein C2G38_2247983 [Gigaspora rosea]|uniref:Uncharacterized protein n=1 Tax=Gigaspora rosea TaxID=44941 RepID=A0A397V6F9_9GLOM|nr:hypothetical protein C2G38_2247983 [Gigaspora rosea]